ncbi:hypothetical protein [Streptosporangium sp. NPDC002721]|uniref:hypothetical protein n=1 Tax=Streptosporangium sp. NPDC002721 TaxID=3366188 RepID=UPI003688575A
MSDVTGREHYDNQVLAGPGGVMTDEVGVITGDLVVRTEVHDDQAHVAVQYLGAEEWYTLTGSPAPLAGHTGEEVHEAVLAAIQAGLPGGLG